MKMRVHIERLILDGLPAGSAQGPQIGAAIQNELTRLLSVHGLANELRGGVAVAHIRAGAIRIGPETHPAKLGSSIARAIHKGIGNSNPGGFPR